MIDNPIKSKAQPKLSAQEWCDIGNARLRGEVPHKDGKFYPRNDVHWIVRDNRCVLQWATASARLG